MFNLIASNVNITDGYYKFTIDHNSKYILTKNKIDDSLVTSSTDRVVNFQTSNISKLISIVLTILIIIIVVIVIFIVKNDNKVKNKKEKVKEEDEESEDIIKEKKETNTKKKG